MKVIIAGSRDYKDYDTLKDFCDKALSTVSVTEIVSGKCRGADALGERYAKERGIPVKDFPADWDAFKNAAGPIRNLQMANYADMLIAFPLGKSSGTYDMINQAKKMGLVVHVLNPINSSKESKPF